MYSKKKEEKEEEEEEDLMYNYQIDKKFLYRPHTVLFS